MEWGRWLIGVVERDEQCRFCGETIHRGERVAVEEEVMEAECITCHWERVRALTKKAKPKPKSKGTFKMPWQKVGGSGAGEIVKWADGMVIEGRVITRRANKFGELMEFQDDKLGAITIGLPARLKMSLALADPTMRFRIECKGKVSIGSGKTAWDFEVFEDR